MSAPREPTGAPAAIPLGARVRFARLVVRHEQYEFHQRGHEWRVEPATPGEGVFVGYRYKQNGEWDRDDSEAYSVNTYWQERSRTKVALVVVGAWREPLTVDPDGLELISSAVAPNPCTSGTPDRGLL